jgi:hypothetical protein
MKIAIRANGFGLVCALVLGLIAASAQAETPAEAKFEKIKALAGEWESTEGPVPTKLIYRVTAGGSAVVETIFPGQPHEMVTVYHMDGETLMCTHYCAAMNQPRMRCTKLDGDTLAFQFLDITNAKDKDAACISQIDLTPSADGKALAYAAHHREGGKETGAMEWKFVRAAK